MKEIARVLPTKKNISQSKKNLISFSMQATRWSFAGALENLKLQPLMYPGWLCRFYVSESVVPEFVEELSDGGAEVVIMDLKSEASFNKFWCFLPWDEESVDVNIVRNVDFRLNLREKYAVEEWLESDKYYHIMRDHCIHIHRILPGMWGIRKGDDLVFNMRQELKNFIASGNGNEDYSDRKFLSEVLYPLIAPRSFIHTDDQRFEDENCHVFPNDMDKDQMHVGMSIHPKIANLYPGSTYADLRKFFVRRQFKNLLRTLRYKVARDLYHSWRRLAYKLLRGMKMRK